MAFGCGSRAPHGGLFVIGIIENAPMFLVALVIGAVITMAGIVLLKSDINIEAEGKKVNAKGVLGVMGLGAKKGAEITVTVDGEDEEIAAAELETFLKENL